MLRKPPEHLNPNKALDAIQEPTWTTLECQLVTPMYGGGVVSHTVDEKMPIRVSSIRGQLRFWWRLLATNSSDDLWQRDAGLSIRQAEADLWGGIDDKTKASKVFLRVDNIKSLQIEAWATYEINSRTGRYQSLPSPKNWANVPYVLFPAQGKRPDVNDAETPHALAKIGLEWNLIIGFVENLQPDPKKPEYNPNITATQKQQVWEAIRWWSQFGGVGARTRRGLGAVLLKNARGEEVPCNLQTPISTDEVQQAGCRLLLRTPQNSAYAAWQQAIQKLQTFRQVNVGRPDHSSRSRWPEPDAIRNIKKQHSPNHKPVHIAGNLFPRAAFGLPIIFKFKDDGTRRTDEPSQSSLQPVVIGNVKERMASPLILRPFYTKEKKWVSAALLLPCQHIQKLQLDLSGSKVSYWDETKAQNVQPIAQYNGTDALSAFLNFFAR